jgi:hypothetical protein
MGAKYTVTHTTPLTVELDSGLVTRETYACAVTGLSGFRPAVRELRAGERRRIIHLSAGSFSDEPADWVIYAH